MAERGCTVNAEEMSKEAPIVSRNLAAAHELKSNAVCRRVIEDFPFAKPCLLITSQRISLYYKNFTGLSGTVLYVSTNMAHLA